MTTVAEPTDAMSTMISTVIDQVLGVTLLLELLELVELVALNVSTVVASTPEISKQSK